MLVPETLIRVKYDPMDIANQMQLMKRLDELALHYDWALSANLNWALILTDHFTPYDGPVVSIHYEGNPHAVRMTPCQRLAVPTSSGGYHWAPVRSLEPGSMIWALPTNIYRDNPFEARRITRYDVTFERMTMRSVTTMDELTFVAYDLICHRNPEGFRASRKLMESAGVA